MQKTQKSWSQNILIPIAILIAGLAIAAAIFLNRATVAPVKVTLDKPSASRMDAFIPATSNDHILGNLDTADIIIVDYSDLECPYCKIFHETLKKVYADFEISDKGKVAWVFRHFPLSIHSKAGNEAQAAECVADIADNETFWNFIDAIFIKTQSNDTLDPKILPATAKELGVDEKKFIDCLASGKFAEKIQDSYNNTFKLTGEEVSPFTVIVTKGQVIPLVDESGIALGALPYTTMKSLISQFLHGVASN